MQRHAVAFPGQGIDPIDLARILTEHRSDPLVDHLVQVIDRDDLDRLDLTDTMVAQPAILTAGLVSARAAVDPSTVIAVVGHSFGEITALAFAGAIDDRAALELVRRRAELCRAENDRRPGQMIVVMRLDDVDIEWIRRTAIAQTGSSLEVAVINGPGQVVLSGDLAATTAAMAAVTDRGAVARPLAIGGAYHSPLLAEVVEPFTKAAAAATGTPRVPLVSCTTQQPLSEPAAIAAALGRALVLPVRWEATMAAVAATGVDLVVDAGPGRTLVNLARHTPTIAFSGLSPERRSRRG